MLQSYVINLWGFVSDGVAIIKFPSTISAVVGENVTITCKADTTKPTIVTFEWKQNFHPILQRNVIIRSEVTEKKRSLDNYPHHLAESSNVLVQGDRLHCISEELGHRSGGN